MTLNRPTPPENLREKLTAGLERLPARAKHAYTTEAMGGTRSELSEPQQVYTVTPEQILGGQGLEVAKPLSWRYLVTQPNEALLGGSALAAAELREVNGEYQFSHLQHGWLGEATKKAIETAQNLPEVKNGSYELRALHLPALLVDALWLKNNAAGTDLFVPIASKSPQLQPGRSYGDSEFMNCVRTIAKQKATFDNSPKNM